MKRTIKEMKIKDLAQKAIREALRDLELDVKEQFFMEMNSEGEMSIRGMQEVEEYTEQYILLRGNGRYIEIKGNFLRLKVYSLRNTGIIGEIDSISFLRR